MPLFSKPQLEHASLSETRVLRKSASVILREATKSLDPTSEFDIFLSHRYLEATHVLGLKNEIEAMGYSVFVDWVEQPDLDRANFTMWTVRWLRDMVSRCACLFYAFSESSAESTWMAWELGYSDLFSAPPEWGWQDAWLEYNPPRRWEYANQDKCD